jgi:hypothetical protein
VGTLDTHSGSPALRIGLVLAGVAAVCRTGLIFGVPKPQKPAAAQKAD